MTFEENLPKEMATLAVTITSKTQLNCHEMEVYNWYLIPQGWSCHKTVNLMKSNDSKANSTKWDAQYLFFS